MAGTVGSNAQVSGLFITGSVEQPVFAEDTKEDQIPLFIGWAALRAARKPPKPREQKIENTAVFATIMEQQTQTAEEDSAKKHP